MEAVMTAVHRKEQPKRSDAVMYGIAIVAACVFHGVLNAGNQTDDRSSKAPDSVLTARGRNGSHDFVLTMTQQASGAYLTRSRNFGYDTEFTITQEPATVYHITGGQRALLGGKGHVTDLLLRKTGAAAYRLDGTNSTYKTDITVTRDASRAYTAQGENLSYHSDLRISASSPYRLTGTHGTYSADVTTVGTGTAHAGPQLKEPLPAQVLLVVSVLVGAKPSGL